MHMLRYYYTKIILGKGSSGQQAPTRNRKLILSSAYSHMLHDSMNSESCNSYKSIARCTTLRHFWFGSSPVYQLVLLVWAQSLVKAERSTSLWLSAMLRQRSTAAASCLKWTEPYNSSTVTLPYSLATTYSVHCWALRWVSDPWVSDSQIVRGSMACTCIYIVCKFLVVGTLRSAYMVILQ